MCSSEVAWEAWPYGVPIKIVLRTKALRKVNHSAQITDNCVMCLESLDPNFGPRENGIPIRAIAEGYWYNSQASSANIYVPRLGSFQLNFFWPCLSVRLSEFTVICKRLARTANMWSLGECLGLEICSEPNPTLSKAEGSQLLSDEVDRSSLRLSVLAVKLSG